MQPEDQKNQPEKAGFFDGVLNRECEMFNLIAFDKNSWDKIS